MSKMTEESITSLNEVKFMIDSNGEINTTDDDDVRPKSSSPSIEKRQKWGKHIEFLLSSLSYAIGLGNIWRFPYLCYKNGGGVFLIPYVLMLFFCGFPLVFFELALGQFGREGPITVWKISPLFQGIGYAMFMISFYIGCYYNVVIAWSIYYIYSSFTSILPWSHCEGDWTTENCKQFDFKNCTLEGGILNATGYCIYSNMTTDVHWNNLTQSFQQMKSPSYEYFHEHVLNISDGFHEMGSLQLHVIASLFIAWVVVFFVLFKGVETFGKAVYFTATFPFFILIVLLARVATLPGFLTGIYFYLTPQWDKLLKISVWGDAAVQIFFSLSPSWGGMITLASYNKFNNNCYRDGLIISIGNCLTSFFAGFIIFGIIGFMAHELGQPIDQVAVQGAGLAFVAYPEAVARLPLSPLWSAFFFFMLLTLGLGTQFTILTTITTTITDGFPRLRGKNFKWTLLACCSVMFSIGLSMTTQGGMYVLQMMDSYGATFSSLMVGMFEVSVVAWVYGIDNFLDDIKFMLGHYPYPRLFWKYLWKYGIPLIIMTILIFSLIEFKPASYEDYEFPLWANVFGWFLSFSSVLLIPIVAVFKIATSKGTLLERIQNLSRPLPEWSPPDDARIRPNESFGAKPLLPIKSFESRISAQL